MLISLLDSSTAAASGYSTQPQDSKIDNIPATKAIKQKEEMHSKKTVPKEAWPEEKKSLQIDIAGNGIGGWGWGECKRVCAHAPVSLGFHVMLMRI